MKDFVATLTKGARWAIGIVLFIIASNVSKLVYPISIVATFIAAAALVVFLLACKSVPSAPSAKEKAEAEKRRADAERELLLKQIESDARKTEAEEAAAKRRELLEYQKRQLEIEEAKLRSLTAETELIRLQVKQMKLEDEKHGRIVTKVAGVTFDNEDGTERQDILRHYVENGSSDSITLAKSSYKGNDAVDVMCGDYCVGKIPKDVIPTVVSVIDRVTSVIMDVNTFENDEGDEIYRADLTIVYDK